MIRCFAESIVEDPAFAWLESTGGRGVSYHLPGEAIPTPEDIFGTAPAISTPSPSNLTGSSSNLTGRRNAEGCLLSDWLPIGKPDVECYVTESAP